MSAKKKTKSKRKRGAKTAAVKTKAATSKPEAGGKSAKAKKDDGGKRPKRFSALDAFTVSVLKVHRLRQAEHRLNMGPAYEDQGLVFAGPLGQPMDPDALSHTWTRITRSIGLRGVRLHDLRHHHATLLLQEGVHPRVVQERLGHASIALTLDTYSHVLPGLQERAAEAFAQAMEDGRHEASS